MPKQLSADLTILHEANVICHKHKECLSKGKCTCDASAVLFSSGVLLGVCIIVEHFIRNEVAENPKRSSTKAVASK